MSNPNGRWEFDKDGNVHYIAPDGTDTPGASPSRPGTPRKNSSHTSKKGDSGWHWFIIILGYVIAWPVGLILMLLELCGKWPSDKKTEQGFRQAASAAKNAASSAAKTAQQQTGSHTPSKAPQNLTRKQKKAAAKKEARAFGLGNIGLLKVLGWAITGVFGFSFVMTLIDEITYFIGLGYALEQLVPLLAFTLIGLTLLGVSGSRSRKLKKFRKYLTMIGNKEEISIAALAKTMGISQKRVLGDVEEMLERGVFETGYIDASRNALVLREGIDDIPEPEPPRETAPEQELSTADATLKHIRDLNDAIENPELSQKIDHIKELTAKIFRLLEERPEKAGDLRSFMNFYLPQTLKILENYATLEAQGIEGDNIAEAKQRIERMMDKVVEGYESQLDRLFANDVLDISADLKVMESMLEKDGLTLENDFKL